MGRVSDRSIVVVAAAGLLLLASLGTTAATFASSSELPNILWITSEDNGPHLGAYGDEQADTPHLDALAERGLVYRNVWSNAPVCAPARTTVITGRHATSIGAQHMRSYVELPAGSRLFPERLRAAGYYTTNNAKEDYNVEARGRAWDESSRTAHWRNRPPGHAFFAVFNLTTTHESQIRRRPHVAVHSPASLTPPPYYPDLPEIRQDWAQYYDKMTEMDSQAGALLEELREAGLEDSTIVVYWGDHGVGLPRGKRTPLNTGLRVPLIVSIPERFAHLRPSDYASGGTTERLVSFVDLAPTMLDLAGIPVPEDYEGAPFLGPNASRKEFLIGYRGRMDGRYDLVRSIRDRHFLYVRNYMPYRRYGEYIDYLFQTPTTRAWQRAFEAGGLPEHQAAFWREKPSEELYDLRSDPHQIDNLLARDELAPHVAVAKSVLGAALDAHLRRSGDAGFLPEAELVRRAAGGSPTSVAALRGPIGEVVLRMAQRASDRYATTPRDRAFLLEGLGHEEAAVRVWAARSFLSREREIDAEVRAALGRAMHDRQASVVVASAEAFARSGRAEDRSTAVQRLVDVVLASRSLPGAQESLARAEKEARYYEAVDALNALESLAPLDSDTVAKLLEVTTPGGLSRRITGYIERFTQRIADVSGVPIARGVAP